MTQLQWETILTSALISIPGVQIHNTCIVYKTNYKTNWPKVYEPVPKLYSIENVTYLQVD